MKISPAVADKNLGQDLGPVAPFEVQGLSGENDQAGAHV